MKDQWLDEVKKRQEAESSQPTGVHFDRLREQGIINERGEVTGQLRRWDAFLAIIEVQHRCGSAEISAFRCLKPVFGIPGGAEIDISRNSMVDYLRQGKKIITAHRDERLSMWKEDPEVHLSREGFVRIDSLNEPEDNVGSLPEFKQSTSRR